MCPRSVPGPPFEKAGADLAESVRDIRVELVPLAAADGGDADIRAPEPPEDLRVVCDVKYPRGKVDVGTVQASGAATPVPSLVTLREGLVDRRPEIQHLADLDGRVAADRLELGGSSECPGDDLSETPQRRFAGAEVAEPECGDFDGVADVDGCDLAADRDVVLGELCQDRCLERATDRAEQRHVEHVAELARPESEVLS